MPGFVPDRGEIVWLDFSPQSGRVQAGRRPALTLSPVRYNDATGLGFFCPITSGDKGRPFDVPLVGCARAKGVVLSDHLRSLDWTARNAAHFDDAPPEILDEVLARIEAILFSGR